MPLISTIEQLKQYVEVDGTLTPTTFLPSVTRAEDAYIKPVLGSAVYNLVAAGTPTSDAAALLVEVRKALAPLTMYIATPGLNIRVSDSGMHNATSQTRERAMKWQVDDYRLQKLIDGYNNIDRLYEYMEAATAADWYNTWKASTAWSQHTDLFLNKASLFNKHVEIRNSRKLYVLMMPAIKRVEEFFIRPAIGAAFFDELKTAYKAGTADDDELKAIEYIQQACAYFAYSLSLKDPGFVNELIIIASTRAEDVKRKTESQNTTEFYVPYLSLSAEMNGYGDTSLNNLISLLNTAATALVYPSYYASKLYAQRTDTKNKTAFKRGNDTATGTYFFM